MVRIDSPGSPEHSHPDRKGFPESCNPPEGVPHYTQVEMTETAIPSDEALARQASLGDRGAFGELIQRNERRALAVAIGLVGNRSDAEEAVQEAFVRANALTRAAARGYGCFLYECHST